MTPDYTQNVTHCEIDGITYTSTKFACLQSLGLFGRAILVGGERGLQGFVASEAAGLVDVVPLLVSKAVGVNVYAAIVQGSYGLKEDPHLPLDLCKNLHADKLHDPGGALLPAPPDTKGHALGDPRLFDQHFGGELPHMIRVLRFVLRHNLMGFTLGPRFQSGSPGTPQPTETAPESV